MDARQRAIRDLIPELIGKTVAVAEALVDAAAPGEAFRLWIRFGEKGFSTDYGFGRITAWVRDGRVFRAEEG